MSVSFPRISPDGKFALVCMSKYGNFTIWHQESDLYFVNIATKQMSKPDLNSPQSESFHSWSSNGRWIVFSSRRIDGRFTRPYISYFDEQGTAHKPFVLPQKDPDFYLTFFEIVQRARAVDRPHTAYPARIGQGHTFQSRKPDR